LVGYLTVIEQLIYTIAITSLINLWTKYLCWIRSRPKWTFM